MSFSKTHGFGYDALEALLYFDKTQNVNVNVKLISAHRLTSTAQNNYVQDLHYILHFVKVEQQTPSFVTQRTLFQKMPEIHSQNAGN